MDYENTSKKKKTGLFESDLSRYFELGLRFIPLFLFVVALTLGLRLELYFSFFDLYLEPYIAACFIVSIIAIIQFIFCRQKFYSTTITGLVLSSLISVEGCMLLILAQYSPISVLLLIIASIGAYFGIRYAVMRLNAPRRSKITDYKAKCGSVAFRLASFVAALIFILPSVAGFNKEYLSDNLTDEEWADFIEWYNSVETEQETGEPDPNGELLAELSRWDRLNISDKARLIRIIAEIEKEYLGISHVTIEVNSEKMNEHTLAYYSPFSRDIYINFRYLNEASLEEAIVTVLHELHHAYVYYTIDNIDFDSPEVQESFYYEDARRWKENSENYISAGLSFEEYYNQPIERDARAHAEERVLYYLSFTYGVG